jgi:hypothetical protein
VANSGKDAAGRAERVARDDARGATCEKDTAATDMSTETRAYNTSGRVRSEPPGVSRALTTCAGKSVGITKSSSCCFWSFSTLLKN